jgi:hypothetical protein
MMMDFLTFHETQADDFAPVQFSFANGGKEVNKVAFSIKHFHIQARPSYIDKRTPPTSHSSISASTIPFPLSTLTLHPHPLTPQYRMARKKEKKIRQRDPLPPF